MFLYSVLYKQMSPAKRRLLLQKCKRSVDAADVEGGGDDGPRRGDENNNSPLLKSHFEAVVSGEWDAKREDPWRAEFVQAGREASYEQGRQRDAYWLCALSNILNTLYSFSLSDSLGEIL